MARVDEKYKQCKKITLALQETEISRLYIGMNKLH